MAKGGRWQGRAKDLKEALRKRSVRLYLGGYAQWS